MTPPEEHHSYRERIGVFVLGKLDGDERTAMQAHLNSCPLCQAEVRELELVVAALADAAPDRIDEDPWPPGDLEELTLAPILGEIHRARRRRRRFQWSALAAAAICVVVIGLAGFTGLVVPEAHAEELSFSGEAPGVEVKEGHLIAHAWSTEIRLIVSGLRDAQTHRVTLVIEDGEQVNADTFIAGDEPLRCTFNVVRLREDAARLEVRTTPGGELVFFTKLPEGPRVGGRDLPLFGILPWPDPGLQNEITGGCDPESREEPSDEGPAPPGTQNKPEAPGSRGGTPYKDSQPERDLKRPSPGGEKPGAAPEESEPGPGPHEIPPAYQPPPEQPPGIDQYEAHP